MKKIYSSLAFLLCLLCSMGAKAQVTTEDIDLTFCLMIDDPSVCYVEDASYNRVELKAGENLFTVKLHKTTNSDNSQSAYSDGISLYIESEKQSDYRITACDVEAGGTRTPYGGFYGATTSMYISFSSEDMNGCVLYPVISNLDDLRTATATVKVDDASKVRISCGNSGYSPVLADGDNTVKFNPDTEAQWRIGHVNYSAHLGGVTLNGTPVSESYGTFELTVAAGDEVAISTEASTDPVSVSFEFLNDGEAALKNVYSYVNYQRNPIEGWKEGFTVDPYSQIVLEFDLDAYDVSVKVNGAERSLYGDLYLDISANTVISVDAKKFADREVTLSLTDPAHVIVGYSQSEYYYSNELDGLVAGSQTVSIPEQNTYLHIAAKNGCVIDKVTYTTADGEQEATAGYSGSFPVPLEEATAVTVLSHENEGWSVSIYVDHADRVYYNEFDYDTYETTQVFFPEGTTTLTFKDSSKYLDIQVKEGFGIASFENVKTGQQVEEVWGSYPLSLTQGNYSGRC